ncbi:FAD-dependent oxidoreductase [Streptomyces sp. NPDC017940]|uniref:FAD-dependent oxidoreductase n=1 Tax=Streptomyces sp. NPDC017940 TaxID=3365017 RepID=UPI0037BA7623
MRTALVLGGGMAGLVAARVLADHAEEVMVLEPDDVAVDQPRQRRGVPQSAHAHILLGRGRQILGDLFPGLFDAMIGHGAELLDFERDGGWYADGLRRVAVPGDDMLSMTRPFLEWHLRRHVLRSGRVRSVRAKATGLTLTGSRVDGVRIARVDGGGAGTPGGPGERIAADLVVDATGRSSRLGDWLRESGFQEPPRRRVGSDIGYATCLFRREPGQRLAGVRAAHSTRTLRSGRPGASSLSPVENGRWIALTTGFADDRPSRCYDEFVARCMADVEPMRELVRACEPIGEVAVYRFPASVRRDFHLLGDDFPAGLVVSGDAVASFNPVYGQGMTTAALHAEALGQWLRSAPDLDRPAGAYFKRIAAVVDNAWETSAQQDLFLPHVAGKLTVGQRAQLYLRDRLIDGCITDMKVHRSFLDVVNMRTGPRTLRRPSILFRALRAPRRQSALR